MTLLMNKFSNIVMDDGQVHPFAKFFSCQKSCDEILSRVIEIWMEKKNHLRSDSNCTNINL